MTATMTETNERVYVQDGWAVRDLPNGDQVRARLYVDTMGGTEEPERDGAGVTLVRERDSYRGIDLDEHDGLREVLNRTGESRAGGAMVYGEEMIQYLPMTREEFVRRYLRAFHGVEDAFLFRHRDQQDWADIWVISETVTVEGANGPFDWTISREGAESLVQEWSDWAKGDCYYAESEYRTLADAMDADGFDDPWGWHDYDALHGGIGSDGALSVLWQVMHVHPYGDADEDSLPRPYEVTEH